jgi:hypothetical protein
MKLNGNSPRLEKVHQRPAKAWRYCVHTKQTLFVSEKPGKDGKDWRYTNDPVRAIGLSPWWQQRFRALVRDTSDYDRVGFTDV